MGSTVNSILLALAAIGGVAGWAFCVVYALAMIIRKKQPGANFSLAMLILCHLSAAAAWLLNMGWIRFILLIFVVPFIYSALFTVFHVKALPNLIHSQRLTVYTLITNITYVLMYAFLPDGDDSGAMYVFFGLIRDYGIDAFWGLSAVCLIVHIIFIGLQIDETVQTKKRVKREKELQEGNWDEFAV